MSSFSVGNNKFYYKNIYDSTSAVDLYRIAKFCDKNTKIGLGACYAGADYEFPATDSSKAVKMNGDSLLQGLGKIFSSSTIYASQSWVMAKPGMFTQKFGFAGYPIQKRFLDEVYQPVWEHLGSWSAYSPETQTIQNISIALEAGLAEGSSSIKYIIYNRVTPTDFTMLDINFAVEGKPEKSNIYSSRFITIHDVYPNPATDYANIDYQLHSDEVKTKIVIHTILGNSLYEYTLDYQDYNLLSNDQDQFHSFCSIA